MPFCVQVITGRYAGSTALLAPGDVCRVGTRAGSDLWLAGDRVTEPTHCAISAGPKTAQIYNLSRAGTLLNGSPANGETLQHGDWLVAGATLLLFLDSSRADQDFDTVHTRLATFLDSSAEPLWYLGQVDSVGIASKILFSLPPDSVVPIAGSRLYLSCIPQDSADLPWLLRTVWGKGLGIFLRSRASLSELTAHVQAGLRRPDIPIFDPRVLRTLLPELRTDQLARVFGPCDTFILESQLAHSALTFHFDQQALKAELFGFCKVQSTIPQQAELAAAISPLSDAAEKYPALASSFSPTPRPFNELEPVFTRHNLRKPEAQLQLALVRAALGDALTPETMDTILAAPGRAPEQSLDQYVALLNERRG